MTELIKSDDEIIAEGLLIIREGLVNKNLKQVSEGYALISGETIEIEEKPPVSRLDNIRKVMSNKHEGGTVLWSGMKTADLKKSLTEMGVEPSKIKGLKREELARLAEAKTLESQINKDISSDEDVNESSVIENKEGKMQIITTSFDPVEAKRNQMMANKKIKMPIVKRVTTIEDTSSSDKEVRFHNNPSKKAPWN